MAFIVDKEMSNVVSNVARYLEQKEKTREPDDAGLVLLSALEMHRSMENIRTMLAEIMAAQGWRIKVQALT